MPRAKVDVPAVRRFWEAGLNDGEIADRLGWDRGTVRKNRRLAGLPVRYTPAEQIRRQGLAGLIRRRNEANAARRSELAGRYGLPGDLAPTQVLAVVALAAGPLTAGELADRCGRSDRPCHRTPFHRFQCPTAAGGNHLTELRRRGLVAYVPRNRGDGGGSGRGAGVYLLTAAAMDQLARARAKETTR